MTHMMFFSLKGKVLILRKLQFIIKLIKYKSVQTRYYKNITVNSCISDIVLLNSRRNRNLNVVEPVLYISSSQNL